LGGFLLFGMEEGKALQKRYVFALDPDILKRYNDFLAGRDPKTLEQFSGEGLSRHTLELIIFQRALHEGVCGCVVIYEPWGAVTSHARQIAEVRSGRLVSNPVAGFGNDPRYDDLIFLSDPILHAEDFSVGLYTHFERQDVLSLQNPDAVRDLRFTASASWLVDVAVIEDYGFKFVPADSWGSAIRMITVNRADVMMQPISNESDFGMVVNDEGDKFLPIPGIKLNFHADRRFFVSEKHPDGAEFLDVLNRGIEKLEATGFLRRGHIAAGVIDQRIQDWTEIK
ncbi:hypothetical protein, partial [Roseibium sp. TrichSKD4]|uniref:hypothetical protein n=1 Tax=Roseibium sp. TrichSKD4 TaxID=744980 RepID=UPI00058FE5E7